MLAPDDAAFEAAGFNRVPGDGMSAAEARVIIEAHVAPRPSRLGEGQAELTTLAGETFRLDDLKAARPCGDNLVVPVRTFLYRPTAARVAAVRHLPV